MFIRVVLSLESVQRGFQLGESEFNDGFAIFFHLVDEPLNVLVVVLNEDDGICVLEAVRIIIRCIGV